RRCLRHVVGVAPLAHTFAGISEEVRMDFEPITVTGVIADEVATPRNDGTAGSALYAVPIRLSRSVDAEEARMLEQIWDHPPRFTTMHRPGVAHVGGNRFVLNKTTVDEVAE